MHLQERDEPDANSKGSNSPPDQHYAIYGNVVMRRARCPSCGRIALVHDDGTMACCDVSVNFDTHRVKRMADAADIKRGPKAKDRREILELQAHRCLYCDRTFGTIVYRGNKPVYLQIHYDHLIPFAYSRNNYPYNFVAACHVCNGIKGSRIFETIEAAKVAIQSRWREKGYHDESPETTNNA